MTNSITIPGANNRVMPKGEYRYIERNLIEAPDGSKFREHPDNPIWASDEFQRAMIDGDVVLVPFVPDIVAERAKAIAQIEGEAEQARLRYVTAGSAKAMVYREQYAEAKEIKAKIAKGETPAPADYVLAAGRGALKALTLEQVADEWVAKGEAWKLAARAIDDAAETAKDAIAAAVDVAEIVAILNGTKWPTSV